MPKLWNWACSQKRSHESCPGFLFQMLEASVCCSLRPKFFLLSILRCTGLYILVFSFDSLILLIRLPSPFTIYFSDLFVLWFFWFSLVYLLPCLLLLSIFSIYIILPYSLTVWILTFSISIFLWIHFLSGAVSDTQFKLVGSHLACSCCLQIITELYFLSRQYFPLFWYHC